MCIRDRGLELGSGIHHKNIEEVFKPLRFKVGNITITGCGAAIKYPEGNNGLLMCEKLAQTVYAYVTASNNTNCLKLHTTETSTAGTWNYTGKLSLLREYNAYGEFTSMLRRPNVINVSHFKRSCKTSSTNKTILLRKKTQHLFQLITGILLQLFPAYMPRL